MDKFTEIDWIVQRIMEQYIEKYFPGLTFIGEEDTTYILEYGDKYKFLTEIVDLNLEVIPASFFEKNEYEFSEIKLFIDPIDATMEFIKKNFAVVTCLVGIVYKDEALAGLVHYPYYEVNDESLSFFNAPGKGIYEYHTYTEELKKLDFKTNDKVIFSCSKSKTTPQMQKSI